MALPSLTEIMPSDLLDKILGYLEPVCLAAVSCTCREMRSMGGREEVWKRHCEKQWQFRDTLLWKHFSPLGKYKQLYASKFQRDAAAKEILDDSSSRRYSLHSERLDDLGLDVEEVVGKLVRQSWREDPETSKFCVDLALKYNLSSCLDKFGQLVQDISTPCEDSLILIAQVFHPFCNFKPVYDWFDGMAQELLRRMKLANVTESLEALKILSSLLFEESVPDDHPEYNFPGLLDEGHGLCWDVLKIPKLYDPKSSFGLKGSIQDKKCVHDSLIPDIFYTKFGTPASLGVIHHAIARRAGLNVRCLPSAIHRKNEWTCPLSGTEYLIDCSSGGKISSSERRRRPWRTPQFRSLMSFILRDIEHQSLNSTAFYRSAGMWSHTSNFTETEEEFMQKARPNHLTNLMRRRELVAQAQQRQDR